MMREIHQSKYSQLIPGVNRSDENIRFTHGERCISPSKDDMSYPQKLIADITNAEQRGRLWNVNKVAENTLKEAYNARDNKVYQWKEFLNKEVDSLAKEIERVEECYRNVCTKKQYICELSRTSQICADFRCRIPGHDSNDEVANLQKQEMSCINKAEEDIQQCLQDLQDCKRKLKSERSSLMSEVEAKAMTLNISKRCQHAEPLFSYTPSDHLIDQIYHPNKEEDWERNLDAKIRNSVDMRQETSKTRCKAESTIKDNTSNTADAWYRTSKAIVQAVQLDEKSLYCIKSLLKAIGEKISSTRQRIASLHDDRMIQDRRRNLQLWQLQNMTYRPGADHIRDGPIKKLDEEVLNLEEKNAFINGNLRHYSNLLQELEDQKHKQTLEMEKLTKKLIIERENCLGLRRSVALSI